jgi:hypothetical protein
MMCCDTNNFAFDYEYAEGVRATRCQECGNVVSERRVTKEEQDRILGR